MVAVVPPPTITALQIKAVIGGTDAEAEARLAEATILVADVLRHAFRDVPVEIVNIVVTRVARAIKDSAKSSTGQGQVTATDALGPRAPADPLASSYALIRRYVIMGV